MVSMKQKLQSNRGASMLMAMVFLMFCLLIGGSVLASATANGSRIENIAEDHQEYYSQRSAMMLLSNMLLDKDGKNLQVVVTDVAVPQSNGEIKHTITISCPGLPADVPYLQKILLEVVVASYVREGVTVKYPSSFDEWINLESPAQASGNFYMACDIDLSDHQAVNYKIHTPTAEGTQDYTLELDFGENKSHLVLKMNGSVNTGAPQTVTVGSKTTTTTTSVIRWSLPDIQKGQYSAEGLTGGNEE